MITTLAHIDCNDKIKNKTGAENVYIFKSELDNVINPYSADFFYFVHFDISFCLGISRKGSI